MGEVVVYLPRYYKRPEWLSRYNVHLSTTEAIEKFGEKQVRKDCEDVMTHNKAVYERLKDDYDRLVTFLTELYRPTDNQVRYFETKVNIRPPPDFEKQVDVCLRDMRMAQAKKLRRQKEKERERRKKRLSNESVKWLIDKDLELGKDFEFENAVQVATELQRDELIQEAKESGKEVYLKHACDCSSWDGKSNRCSCGNRRVFWDYNGTWPDVYIFPEAD